MNITLQKVVRKMLLKKYYFGACPCMREDLPFFNVGSSHWLYCDKCRVRWCVGENSFSGWHSENEEIWRENMGKYGDYRIIDGDEFLREFDAIPVEPTIASQSEMGHNTSVDPTSLPPQSAL
jgi:hypothetical protein